MVDLVIEPIRSSRFHNLEVYKFGKDFILKVEEHGPTSLGVDGFFPVLRGVHNEIKDLIINIKKSAYTIEIKEADEKRDKDYSLMRKKVNADLGHFDVSRAKSAYRLSLVFNAFGDVPDKAYLEETGAIDNFIEEVRNNNMDDINTLGLNAELDQLEVDNNHFEDLFSARLDQIVAKPNGSMKELRKRFFESYDDHVARITALININGSQNYKAFVDDINARIKYYNDTIARREGRNK